MPRAGAGEDQAYGGAASGSGAAAAPEDENQQLLAALLGRAPVVEPGEQWEADALPSTGQWGEWNEFLERELPYSGGGDSGGLLPDRAALPFDEGDEALLSSFEDDQVRLCKYLCLGKPPCCSSQLILRPPWQFACFR